MKHKYLEINHRYLEMNKLNRLDEDKHTPKDKDKDKDIPKIKTKINTKDMNKTIP